MPWTLFKEGKTEDLGDVMYHLVEVLRKVSILVRQAMEKTSMEMLKQLGIDNEQLTEWNSINDYPEYDGIKVVEKGEPLFIRLDAEKEIEYMSNIMKGN